MHVLKHSVTVASVGEYKFDDGRKLKYVDLLDGDGAGVMRANFAEGFNEDGLTALASGKADLEVYTNRNGALRLRIVAFTPNVNAAQLKAA